jgi:hypothetical protein
MSVTHLRFVPVGETMFPPRTPFFQRQSLSGNLPVPLGPLPAHGAEVTP